MSLRSGGATAASTAATTRTEVPRRIVGRLPNSLRDPARQRGEGVHPDDVAADHEANGPEAVAVVVEVDSIAMIRTIVAWRTSATTAARTAAVDLPCGPDVALRIDRMAASVASANGSGRSNR